VNLRSCPPTWKRLSRDERGFVEWLGQLMLSTQPSALELPFTGRWGTTLTKREVEAATSLAKRGLVAGSYRKENDAWYVTPTEHGRALLVWLWRRP
jgi:hypothetical protein